MKLAAFMLNNYKSAPHFMTGFYVVVIEHQLSTEEKLSGLTADSFK